MQNMSRSFLGETLVLVCDRPLVTNSLPLNGCTDQTASLFPCRMKDCLRKVNDTSSRVVGQAFFNVIGVPCFELAYEEQCAERHWYGM